MSQRYSHHKITDKNNCPFSETEYSKFKFGDRDMADKFADELFEGFIAQHRELILAHEEIVILPSPYHTIPTASNYLSLRFKKRMNAFLFKHNRKSLSESKIYRNQTYTTDYGNLDYNDRLKMISNDTYYIDRNYINGKLCLFIDDIKITGSHEHIVNKILVENDVQGNFVFLYYGELMNMEIPPNIENYYNYFFVKDVPSLCSIINSKSFVFNTRTVKYILKLDHSELLELMRQVPEEIMDQLFHLAVSNNYHTIADYRDNLEHISLNLTNIQSYNHGYKLTERSA